MSATGKGLLALIGPSPKPGRDDDEESDDKTEDDDKSDVDPGQEAAMADFCDACDKKDHAAMARALSDFLDMRDGS